MGSVRDFQKSRLYKWENSSVPKGQTLTLDDCKSLVADVWERYRPYTEPPRIKDGRGTSIARGSSWLINLPLWARTTRVVLHEVGHGLANDKHGPQYTRVLLDLFARYKLGTLRELSKSAKAAGLKVAQAAACPRPVRANKINEVVEMMRTLDEKESGETIRWLKERDAVWRILRG